MVGAGRLVAPFGYCDLEMTAGGNYTTITQI